MLSLLLASDDGGGGGGASCDEAPGGGGGGGASSQRVLFVVNNDVVSDMGGCRCRGFGFDAAVPISSFLWLTSLDFFNNSGTS